MDILRAVISTPRIIGSGVIVMATDTEPIDVDTAPDEREVSARAIAVRSPQIPVTLLRARRAEQARQPRSSKRGCRSSRHCDARRSALTSPPDWVLHKAPDEAGGQIVGYLQDAGADRVRDLWGIEVHDVSTPEKVAGVNPEDYHYIVTGSGRCKLTRQTIEQDGRRAVLDR